MHDRSSLFRLPAEGIVRATNPAPTLDPSFAVGREDRGEVSILPCFAQGGRCEVIGEVCDIYLYFFD